MLLFLLQISNLIFWLLLLHLLIEILMICKFSQFLLKLSINLSHILQTLFYEPESFSQCLLVWLIALNLLLAFQKLIIKLVYL